MEHIRKTWHGEKTARNTQLHVHRNVQPNEDLKKHVRSIPDFLVASVGIYVIPSLIQSRH